MTIKEKLILMKQIQERNEKRIQEYQQKRA